MKTVLVPIIISLMICHIYLYFYEKQNDKLLKDFLKKLERKTIEIINNYLQDRL